MAIVHPGFGRILMWRLQLEEAIDSPDSEFEG
jgi:hypothetical protein